MRIEVLIGSEDPIIFPLKSAKVIIGSGENCDLTLDASGISRKHLAVITEGDQYFVIDQGSTNGSFLNEERLVPGKKTEFTSFFPVRLGDNVLVSLLSDEEDIDYSIPFKKEATSPNISAPKDDSTTVIKLNDLKKVSTEKLVLERNQKRDIRKKPTPVAPPKPAKKSLGVIQISAILLVAVAAYYQFFLAKNEVDDGPVAEIGKVVKVEKIEQPVVVSDTIPKDELPSKDSFLNLLNDLKCSTDSEKYLCDLLPSAKGGLFGVSQVGLTYKAVIDGTRYIQEARNFIKVPADKTPEAMEVYERLVNKTAAYLYVMRYMANLDEQILGDTKLAIGFFTDVDGSQKLQFVIAFFPKVFNREKPNLKESDMFLIRNNGEAALKSFESHFTIY